MMTVSGIIGAGIFLNPSIVAQRVGTEALTLAVWALGGLIALAGAFCFAELGSRFPRAGGGYVYLRDAFGPLWGFLYGWTLLLVINSGAIAAVSVIAATYLLGLVGGDAGMTLPLALFFIAGLTGLNVTGIVPGAKTQSVLTVLKLGALGLLIVAGLLLPLRAEVLPAAEAVTGGPAMAASPPIDPTGVWELVKLMGAALIPVMFATGGWQNSNFVGGEIHHPRRNLPRAIVGGVSLVVVVYVLANAAYLRTLGVGGLAASTAPASEALRNTLGPLGADAIGVGIVISTLGLLQTAILAAPRVYQAMASDGLFFRGASRLHPRFHTPVGALLFQAVWASVLALSGTYGQLLDYVVFGDWIFFGAVAATLFVVRRREARGEKEYDSRPSDAEIFRIPAVGLVAGGFVLAAAAIVLSSIVSNPGNAAVGAGLIGLGIPVHAAWRRRSSARTEGK